MGEIADAMLNGETCSVCGVMLDGPTGYPRQCAGCGGDAKEFRPPRDRRPRTKCPECGRWITKIGLADHRHDVHGISKE